MRVRLTVAALATALAAGAALPATAGGPPSAPPVSAGSGYVSADQARHGGPIHGMIVADANRPFDVSLPDLQRLADDGVNQVTFYVTWYFSGPDSAKISSGAFTPTDTEISTAVQAAHRAGLTVQIDPILWSKPGSPDGYHWRGVLDPTDQDSFWASYDALILRYAKLSQANGVEMFAVGSELRALEHYTSRWRQLAAAVRRVYDGQLTYMALTWSVQKVRFWRSLDYIGVSPYYGLSTELEPTYAQLRSAWTENFRGLRATSHRVHRPVLFNEIGYISAQGATAKPWLPNSPNPPSQTVQATAYEALLDAARNQPWLHGIVFYYWSTPVGPTDKTWTPKDKRAECALATRWASPSSPRLPDGQPRGCLGAELADKLGVA